MSVCNATHTGAVIDMLSGKCLRCGKYAFAEPPSTAPRTACMHGWSLAIHCPHCPHLEGTSNAVPPPVDAASNIYDREINESILQEAHRLTHGDRAKDYGPPVLDYTRTAALVSALLADKLKAPLTAHEMALAMCCVKLSREVHSPKRDNMVDLAGYAWVAHSCLTPKEI